MLPVIHARDRGGEAVIGRRELLRAGGLSLLGLSTVDLARLRALAASDSPTAGRRRN